MYFQLSTTYGIGRKYAAKKTPRTFIVRGAFHLLIFTSLFTRFLHQLQHLQHVLNQSRFAIFDNAMNLILIDCIYFRNCSTKKPIR